MIDAKNSILIVKSITNAMRGQKILEQNGISAYTIRNPNPSSRQGCGYGLKIASKNAQKAANLLAGAGIQVSEIRGEQHDLL